jgi:hypothetical protein
MEIDSGLGFAVIGDSLGMAQAWRQIIVAWSTADDDWIFLADVWWQDNQRRTHCPACQRL